MGDASKTAKGPLDAMFQGILLGSLKAEPKKGGDKKRKGDSAADVGTAGDGSSAPSNLPAGAGAAAEKPKKGAGRGGKRERDRNTCQLLPALSCAATGGVARGMLPGELWDACFVRGRQPLWPHQAALAAALRTNPAAPNGRLRGGLTPRQGEIAPGIPTLPVLAGSMQDDGQWVQFDDEQMILRKEEEIQTLAGGGDWHMAYLLLYKAQRVPKDA